MSNQAGEIWKAFSRGPVGRILGAAILPAWLLLLGSATHGPPAVTASTGTLLSVVTLVGGCIGAGLGLWCIFARDRAQATIEAWTAEQHGFSPLQHLIGLPGVIAFLAACYQVVFNFNIWRDMAVEQGWPRAASLSSWDTLLALSAAQLIFFAAQRFADRR